MHQLLPQLQQLWMKTMVALHSSCSDADDVVDTATDVRRAVKLVEYFIGDGFQHKHVARLAFPPRLACVPKVVCTCCWLWLWNAVCCRYSCKMINEASNNLKQVAVISKCSTLGCVRVILIIFNFFQRFSIASIHFF